MNEAASNLVNWMVERGWDRPEAEEAVRLVSSLERRATVERIREAAYAAHRPNIDDFIAILDAVGQP
jgi:hypothetical protein